jgi:hypothetical protein
MHDRIVVLKRGKVMYRRSTHPETIASLVRRDRFVWLAFEPAYGVNSYGPRLTTWTVQKPLRLLNIGSMDVRRAISVLYDIPIATLVCDEQYSGGEPNMRFHKTIAPILRSLRVHGTFISDTSSNADCEGPSEVVLFPNQMHRMRRRPVATKTA